MLTVWIDSWQMQCCGKPFAVDDQVEWSLVADPDVDHASALLGAEAAARITHREEHHAEADAASITVGTVHAITAVSCRFGPGADASELFPVSGTQVLTPKERADGWEPEADGEHFVAYLVELIETDVG